MKGDFEIYIGSSRECTIRVNRPEIDEKHAVLRRDGDRLFLKDLHSRNGVTVNGGVVTPGKWVEVSRYDNVLLAGRQLEMSAQLFIGRDRLDLISEPLRFEADGKTLCDDAWVRADSGTLTALMGPSGCGKSVLLNLLIGNNKPTAGRVMVGGGRYDLHRDFALIRQFIGFVPQAEVMYPELTVAQSLHYRLRLRHPDMSKDVRNQLIAQAGERLGFRGERLERFLNTRIGSPEDRGAVLSGGERRRANIAHELVTQPLVLFLDEPTSGLSSVDADDMISLLHNLARHDGLTILTTIHQPSRDAFAQFDNLILMSYGGTLLYNGPAADAAPQLAAVAQCDPGNGNPADFVLKIQEEEPTRQQLRDHFVEETQAHNADPSRLAVVEPATEEESSKSNEPDSQKLKPRQCSVLHEFRILLQRNLKIFLSERATLLFTFGQIPMIALMVILAFQGSFEEQQSADVFNRTAYWHNIDVNVEGATYTPTQFIQHSKNAPLDNTLISSEQAQQRAKVYFILCLSSVWFGVMGACKEIVTERAILQREKRTGLRLANFIAGKFAMQSGITGIQTFGVAMPALFMIMEISASEAIKSWLILWLTAACAAALGLFISSAVRTYRAALALVPLVIIPQVLFSGLLRSFGQSDTWAEQIGKVMPLRWSFQAILESSPFAHANVLFLNPSDLSDIYPTWGNVMQQFIQSDKTGLIPLIFGNDQSLNLALMVLAGFTCAFLMGARVGCLR